jgi:phosphatidylglycerophosphatase A
VAPGTVGSAAAVGIAVLLHRYAGLAPWHFLLLAAGLFFPAVWAAGVSAKAANIEDPGFVVVDEVIGQWIALAGARTLNWETYLAAFALFRLFDIWKPPPVRQLEALPGGWGINADDVMAGVYAALVLLLAGWFNLY